MKTKTFILGIILVYLISVACAQPNLEINPETIWFNVSDMLPGESTSKNVVLSNTGDQWTGAILLYAQFNNSCTPIEPNGYCIDGANLTDVLNVDLIYGGFNITDNMCTWAGDYACPLTVTELGEGIALDGLLVGEEKDLNITILFDPAAGNEYQATSAVVNFSFTITYSTTTITIPSTRRRNYMEWDIEGEYVNETVSITVVRRNTDRLLDGVDVDIFFNDKKIKSMLTENGLAWFTPLEPGTYRLTGRKSRYRDLEAFIEIMQDGVTITTTTTTTTTTTVTTPHCTSHYKTMCLSEFVWWVDSCNNYEEIAERCEDGCDREVHSCFTTTTTTSTTTTSVTTTTISEKPPVVGLIPLTGGQFWLLMIILIIIIVVVAILILRYIRKTKKEEGGEEPQNAKTQKD